MWLLALALGALGSAVLAAALAGVIGSGAPAAQGPPPIAPGAATPVPGALAPADAPAGAIIGASRPLARGAEQGPLARGLEGALRVPVGRRWMEGFYPIYATAQRTFGVNWLLIASIHRQESAFSSAPGTYAGLNFAHCCGGPMQFNVTNGPVSTWQLVSDSYLYGARPAAYDHMTAAHPSIYDDFDAVMAGAHLLSADGAQYALDWSAWVAAYDYYGHDADGVAYADEVLARAIGWSQHGFCAACGVAPSLLEAVHAAYGARVLAQQQQTAPRRR
jgi:hypothetical protein